MAVPYTFGTATAAIPLSQLDTNFATAITIGNTAVQLGNTVTTLNNMTLANVTISSGNVTITNVAVTTANVTTANIANSIITTGETLSYGTANGVAYLSTNKVVTTGSALTFDGTNLGLGGTNNSYGSQTTMTLSGTNVSRIDFRSNSIFTGTILSYQAVTEGLRLQTEAGYPITFYPAGSEAMRLTSTSLYTASGINVGIGTSSPGNKLQVASTGVPVVRFDSTQTASNNILITGGSSYNYGVVGVVTGNNTASGDVFTLGYTASAGATASQVLNWTSSGNVGIGTTSSVSGGNATRLVISTNITTTAGISIATSADSSGGVFQQFVNASNAIIGSITQSGTTAVLYNTTSDQRLKENIVDAPEFGSVIDAIQVRSYNWKSDGSHQRAGFVAQELVNFAPEAVHQPTKEEDMMAVDYSKLVPMLVKEIQSLRVRLSALEAK